MTAFCFTKGVNFDVPKKFQHIVPALLDRVFNVDNNKKKFFWEMGNCGSIYGDVFVKVAYEQPCVVGGVLRPGRCRLVLLNPAHCFPRWHPHDKGRMQEFKQKYRFWKTAPDGTRLTHTYVELITDTVIKEYLDDKLMNERPNPMGKIPIVHIVNKASQGSPWGLSDIYEIIDVNRVYNELSTLVEQIIDYHANPVTVMTGGKPPQLEMGPNKIWATDNEAAKIFNLTGGVEGLAGAEAALQRYKTFMFEMTGIPINALGQEQAISNTSGVALSIQYMPTMQHFDVKEMNYGEGSEEIAKLILETLFVFEPNSVLYNDDTDGIKEEEDQPWELDPTDPAVYRIDVRFTSPLPIDVVVKLQEIQLKLALGLESRRGAMKDLGEAFPDEKLRELAEELLEDAKDQAAIDMLKAQMGAVIMALTGIVPEGAGEPVPPQPVQTGPDGTPTPQPEPPPVQKAAQGIGLPDLEALTGVNAKNLVADIAQRAYGMRKSSQRNLDSDKVGQPNG